MENLLVCAVFLKKKQTQFAWLCQESRSTKSKILNHEKQTQFVVFMRVHSWFETMQNVQEMHKNSQKFTKTFKTCVYLWFNYCLFVVDLKKQSQFYCCRSISPARAKPVWPLLSTGMPNSFTGSGKENENIDIDN